jgi:Winged helix DNA-binding domain
MTVVAKLSWEQVLARRLERQHLAGPPAGLVDVVGRLAAVHAQVMSAAELAVGLRAAGVTRADVREALWTERSLVKTRGPRGTVHLLRTQDLPMWIHALSATPPPAYLQGASALLTPEQVDLVVAAIADALRDAELTTDELTEQVVARAGPWAGDLVMEAFQGKWPRWMQAMAEATRRGAMCFGPNRGNKTTHTSPRRWLPGFEPVAPDADRGRAALAEVVRRYLHVLGPATGPLLAQWLAVPPRWAQDLLDSLAGELEQVDVEGTLAWVAAGDTAAPSDPPSGLRLLPYFDAYAYPVSGPLRDRLYPGRAAERVAGNHQVLVLDGVVAGLWHQRRSGRKLSVTVEPLTPLSAARRRELDDEVARVGQIVEAVPQLTIGEVTVGGHA